MITDWKTYKEFLRADMHQMGVPLAFKTYALEPSARFIIVLRTYEYILNTQKPKILLLFIKVYFKLLSIKLGFSLGPNIFDSGLAIVHHGLLIIDTTTKIGKNCRIHMGVHIGGSAQFVDPEFQEGYSPRIGNNVYIGPGCKIYGPIKIGDNATIGANAVLTKSFPQVGVTIAGVPAKIINQQEGTNKRVMS